MTDAKTVANIILDSGGTNSLTVYTESCEKVYSKILTNITPPQNSANRALGKKDTKIVDLLRIEIRFTVRGTIDSADETKLENLMTKGGIVTFTYKTTVFNINFEKMSITNDNKTENDETPITFTALVGVDI
jgi:hypothetical protein